jgi:ArsR family transcriptional regulator, cadmium/lead-responsive transcriptional repressor
MRMATTTPAPSIATRAKLFRGFSDASRLGILEALRAGPCNVGDLVEATGLGQPNVSNHLACLLDCGLVSREQRGRFVYYGLTDPRVAKLLRMADELLSEVALGVEACARYERSEDA